MRKFILLNLILLSFLSFSCSGRDSDKDRIPTENNSIEKIYIRNGRLLYGAKKSHKPISSIYQLLSLYTEEERVAIIEFSLAGQAFNEIDSLDMLPNLEKLSLGGNNFTSMKGIEKAPKLKDLNLSDNPISKIEYLSTLEDLEGLGLSHTRISRIEGVSGLVNLKELLLSHNKISKIEGLNNLPSLVRLSLSGNQLTDYSGLLEIESISEISIASNDNVVDESAIEVFKEWNKRFPDCEIKWEE